MSLYKLVNPLKNYAWGSPDFIPRLLGRQPDPALPVAEMWLGAHPAGCSKLDCEGREISLRELIASDPVRHLGRGAELAAGELPFLLKVLAAEQPLSIQAHPSGPQARLGFERENSLGLPLDSPLRNYRDPRPKPELICALTEFKALCGFRPYPEIVANLRAAGLDSQLKSFAAFARHPNWHSFLKLALELLSLREAALQGALATLKNSLGEDSGLDSVIRATCQTLLNYYPQDPGTLAPLYLNIFTLQPGEALFLGAGVMHAYLQGAGIEIMGNSDNVLRGGLTPKHVDLEELARILDFNPYTGGVIALSVDSPYLGSYLTAAREFELSHICLDGYMGIGYDEWQDPLIAFCGDGSIRLDSGDCSLQLERGEAAFISADAGDLHIGGTGELWLATLPAQN